MNSPKQCRISFSDRFYQSIWLSGCRTEGQIAPFLDNCEDIQDVLKSAIFAYFYLKLDLQIWEKKIEKETTMKSPKESRFHLQTDSTSQFGYLVAVLKGKSPPFWTIARTFRTCSKALFLPIFISSQIYKFGRKKQKKKRQ